MPVFKEHPRGGKTNVLIEPSEIRIPCVVLIDTSGSMARVKDQLEEGLATMAEALNEEARGRVEFCVICFGDDAQILVPFVSAYDFVVPHFDCDGMTAMHAAVDLGLGELEARKAQYKANGILYSRPWMFMLTDSGANDADNGAFERLVQSQIDKRCTFFSVAIGDQADKELLKSLRTDGLVLTASKEDFRGAFVWLSNSLSQTSCSKFGDIVKLPPPKDYQMEIVVDA